MTAVRPRNMRLILVVVFLVLTPACSTSGTESRTPKGENTAATSVGPVLKQGFWTRLPDSPLSPRERPAAAYVDGEIVVVGGYSGPPCPPGADCARPVDAVERDGAAYDLRTESWRRIADAPRPVPELASTAVIGERMYVLADGALLAWDSATDSWDKILPPRPLLWSTLVADGTRLVVASGSDENGIRPDHVLDTITGEWSSLPRDPLKPSFDRTITTTPSGLVLTAKQILAGGGPADPALVRAAVLPSDGRAWRVLPTSEQLGGWRWSWTGRRLVDPTLGGADGGETNNFGRVIPYGGRLDPVTGEWSPLPDAPDEGTGGWPVEAMGGPVTAAEGWLYDDADGSWTRLPRPAGAPAAPGTAVWAGPVLVVLGGVDWHLSDKVDVRSTEVWAYRVD